MHADVEALLAVQREDLAINALEARRAALEPRLRALDERRAALESAHARAKQAAEASDHAHRELQHRAAEQHTLDDRNRAQLGSVTSAREASAAMSQADQSRRMVAESEIALRAASQRSHELHEAEAREAGAVAELAREQEATRAAAAEEQRVIDEELGRLRAQREAAAQRVPRALLARYDRIHGRRRTQTLYPLRGLSCGHCDVAIPLQRRNEMITRGTTEMCEGCGVLLYAPD